MRRASIGFFERDVLIEEFAKKFYAYMGYHVRNDYRMQEATHPTEVMCVEMAIWAIERLAGKESK